MTRFKVSESHIKKMLLPVDPCHVLKVHIFWEGQKFYEIFTLLLSYVVPVQSKVKILQNVVAFSEYMNFHKPKLHRYCFQVELRLNHITKDQSIFNFCYSLYLLKALAIRNKSYNTVHFIMKKIQMKWKALMNGSPLGILHFKS